MILRTTALAAAVSLGLGSAASAQSVYVDTPFLDFSIGAPAPYDPYGGASAYAPAPYRYGSPYEYERGWQVRPGDRADEHIYVPPGSYTNDTYNNQTGVNNN